MYERHGNCNIPEYSVWCGMKQRCLNPNSNAYKRYSILSICKKWRDSFEDFYTDMGDRPSPRHTIERINNDKGYYYENCVWATMTEQNRNKKIHKNNNSGITGVGFDNQRNKFRARIMANGKQIDLGRFNTLPDAIIARKQGEQEYWNKSGNLENIGD